jgi:hypothetical protein
VEKVDPNIGYFCNFRKTEKINNEQNFSQSDHPVSDSRRKVEIAKVSKNCPK